MRFAGSKIANLLGDKPNYDEIGSQGTMESALGAANTALNNAKAADAVMRSEAEILAAEANADAIAAQGQAQATASMANSIGSAIGGLAGSFGSMGGGGGVGGGFGVPLKTSGLDFSGAFNASGTGYGYGG